MRFNLKHIKQSYKKKHHKLSEFNQIINFMPYKELSIRHIQSSHKSMMKPLYRYFMRHQGYKPNDSRILNFGALHKDSRNRVKVYGFIGGYRIKYNFKYHQAFIYVLLKYVFGLSYNKKFIYLTDHLWINPNQTDKLIANPVTIGIGDCVYLTGTPTEYQGTIGKSHQPCLKSALKDIDIKSSGYPLIKNHRFMRYIVPYNHRLNFLFTITQHIHKAISVGHQISNYDLRKLRDGKYALGDSFSFKLGRVLKNGMKFQTGHNKDPYLIARITNSGRLNIRWTYNRFSATKNLFLTTARSLRAHPIRTEQSVHKKLQDKLGDAYQRAKSRIEN